MNAIEKANHHQRKEKLQRKPASPPRRPPSASGTIFHLALREK
jgi:hypothetical protein